MMFGIKIVALGNQPFQPPEWVTAYDPNAHDGRGDSASSADPAKALRFDTLGEAWEFWRQPSTVRPVRPDGQPNRPLTAFTVSIEALP